MWALPLSFPFNAIALLQCCSAVVRSPRSAALSASTIVSTILILVASLTRILDYSGLALLWRPRSCQKMKRERGSIADSLSPSRATQTCEPVSRCRCVRALTACGCSADMVPSNRASSCCGRSLIDWCGSAGPATRLVGQLDRGLALLLLNDHLAGNISIRCQLDWIARIMIACNRASSEA